jgi:hypothetical protein
VSAVVGTRRRFLAQAASGAAVMAAGVASAAEALDAAGTSAAQGAAAEAAGAGSASGANGSSGAFWPNDARLVISISMQFEAGGQPPMGADSRSPKSISRPA